MDKCETISLPNQKELGRIFTEQSRGLERYRTQRRDQNPLRPTSPIEKNDDPGAMPPQRRRRPRTDRAEMSDRKRRRLVQNLLRVPSVQGRAQSGLNWRWVRARELAEVVDRLSIANAKIDPMITRALKFIRLMRRGAFRIAVRRDADLARAFMLSSDQRHTSRRALIEAFLISKAEFSWIAETCNLPVGVIEAYAAVFFDVRDLLKYPLFIHGIVLANIHDPTAALDRGDLLRRVGHALGRDAVIRFASGSDELTSDDKAFLVRIIRKRLIMFAWTYVHGTKITKRNARRIILQAADLEKLKFDGLRGKRSDPDKDYDRAGSART